MIIGFLGETNGTHTNEEERESAKNYDVTRVSVALPLSCGLSFVFTYYSEKLFFIIILSVGY